MEERLKTLKRQCGACKARLTHLETFITGYLESGEPFETLQTKIEFVQNTWKQFEDVQLNIEELEEDDDERPACEERYCSVIGRARALVNSLRHPAGEIQSNAGGGAGSNGLQVKLPTMNLPVFDGNSEKWLEFRDSFQGLIDANRDLSDIQRMYYLRSSLKGRAAEIIQSLESSAENYRIAWNLLTKRFEDKRAIAARHLQLLLEIPAMQRESGSQLRQNLDSLLRHVRALEQLKANTWDTVINHLMIAKFDSTTRRDWRTYIKDKETISVASLTEFLEERCSIIEPEIGKVASGKPQSDNRAENKPGPRQKRVESSNTFASTSGENRSVRNCALCNEDTHSLYACNTFKELTVPQRLSAVNERRLCRNCLRPNHFAGNCQSSSCKLCHAEHNTLLHPSDQNTNTKGSAAPKSTTNVNSTSAGGLDQPISSVNYSSVNIPVQSRVLLFTARVLIYDFLGNAHECRALLDSASQSNFLTKEFCDRLKLKTQKFNCTVGGLVASINFTESACTYVQSRHSAYRDKIKFLITKRIIDKLPLSEIEVGQLPIP